MRGASLVVECTASSAECWVQICAASYFFVFSMEYAHTKSIRLYLFKKGRVSASISLSPIKFVNELVVHWFAFTAFPLSVVLDHRCIPAVSIASS